MGKCGGTTILIISKVATMTCTFWRTVTSPTNGYISSNTLTCLPGGSVTSSTPSPLTKPERKKNEKKPSNSSDARRKLLGSPLLYFLYKTHLHFHGFNWGHQCSWTLTTANNRQVSIKTSSNHDYT